MAEVYLRRLSRWQAEQQRNSVADVYAGTYRGVAGAAHGDRQIFLRRLEQHVQHTGFDMVVADSGGTVGCAYGFRVPSSGEWCSGLRGALPTDVEELTASGRTFLLAELMVLPAHRRRGIATRMAEQLLIRLDADLVVAATDGSGGGPGNAAEETFRAWGWSMSRAGVSATGPAAGSGADALSGTGGDTGGTGPSVTPRRMWIRRPLR